MKFNCEDYIGKKFGELTVVDISGKTSGNGRRYLHCKCSCGNYTDVLPYQLNNGAVKSCGCLRKINHPVKHGYAKTRVYNIWANMIERCYNPNNPGYYKYGARGISVCEEWRKNSGAFIEWALANGYKDGLSIDRINNNGNYEPSNCRWTTSKQQSRNKRNTWVFEHNGERKLLVDWCDEIGIPYRVAYSRISYYRAHGKPLEFEKIFRPIRKSDSEGT